MDIVGDRKFVEVPGSKTHELPPLLVRSSHVRRMDKVMDMASDIVDSEDLIQVPPSEDPTHEVEIDRRRMDLAVNLVEQYLGLLQHWHWGDSIIEWIRQCETTFGSRLELRNLLRADLWPHAGRSSFVTLLHDKEVDSTEHFELQKAMGLRLTFRQPPPIRCCSNQFLFYLNQTVASSAYQTWASLSPTPVAALPPERFSFQVVNMALEGNDR
jgi:hypothetical protein